VQQIGIDNEGNVLVLATDELVSLTSALQERWRTNLGTNFKGRWLSIAGDGRIFTGGESEVAALRNDGSEVWRKQYATVGNATLGLQELYLNSSSSNSPAAEAGRTLALDLEGNFRWSGGKLGPEERSISTMPLKDGSLIHLSWIRGSENHLSVRRLRSDGAVLLDGHFKAFGGWPEDQGPPAPVADANGRLYFSFGRIYAVDMLTTPVESGWPLWHGDRRNSGAGEGGEPEADRLHITGGAGFGNIFFKSSQPDPLVLERSDDLLVWQSEREFTSEVRVEIPDQSGPRRFYRVVRKQ